MTGYAMAAAGQRRLRVHLLDAAAGHVRQAGAARGRQFPVGCAPSTSTVGPTACVPALQTVVRIVDILGKQTPATMATCFHPKHWLMHAAFAAPWITSCTPMRVSRITAFCETGLEVRVAFGGVWKQSLTELSGGQRSLLALSLILAMLLFKPAPIYILDEVRRGYLRNK